MLTLSVNVSDFDIIFIACPDDIFEDPKLALTSCSFLS